MNILLTNDDGYFSEGIKVLKQKLSKYGKVVVVAPKSVMSAKSTAITLGVAMEVKQIEDDVFACDGTPADCVAFGMSSLNIDFDLVVSGCNHGFNISYDVMYSGTVGACLQALTHKKPAIAFSTPEGFSIVNKYFDRIFKYVLDNRLLSTEYLLNINFPLGEEVDNVELTHIFYRPEATFYIKQSENHYLAWREIHDEKCDDIGSDVYAVYHHNVSISKINKI